jgi:predicted aspartyl protease
MIIGVVNAQTEATIRLPVRASDGREREIEVILDTGFNGSLTLPPMMIVSLGLEWHTRVAW